MRMRLCMMSALAAVVVIVFVMSVSVPSGVSAASSRPVVFSFADFIIGNWVIQRAVIDLSTGEEIESDDAVLSHMSVIKENGTENYIGTTFENDTETGEFTNEGAVLIEFAEDGDGSVGTFLVGSNDLSLGPLFSFAFRRQRSGAMLSFGPYHGDNNSEDGDKSGDSTKVHYQFVIGSWDMYVLTVYGEEEGKATVFSAQKIPEVLEKTFFQKYGTMMMVGAMLMMQMWVQGKANGVNSQRNAAAAASAAGGETSSETPISETATIEEITDNDDSNDSKKEK